MLVIIEGNEGTGKTTLINNLAERITFATVKYPKEFKKTFEMLKFFAESDNLFVLDRSFVSDLVYRRLDHKSGQMNLYQIGKLCGDYCNRIKIVFCSNENAFKNAITRGEKNITVESVHKLLDAEFYSVKNMIDCFTAIEILSYDYAHDSIDDVINFIGGPYANRS